MSTSGSVQFDMLPEQGKLREPVTHKSESDHAELADAFGCIRLDP